MPHPGAAGALLQFDSIAKGRACRLCVGTARHGRRSTRRRAHSTCQNCIVVVSFFAAPRKVIARSCPPSARHPYIHRARDAAACLAAGPAIHRLIFLDDEIKRTIPFLAGTSGCVYTEKLALTISSFFIFWVRAAPPPKINIARHSR